MNISIIMPYYNAALCIREIVDAILPKLVFLLGAKHIRKR